MGMIVEHFLLRCPPELMFMNINGQRARVPGVVIIDGGSGYCKFGWSKYTSPSGRSATFLEFGNIESPMYSRLQHFYATIYSRMQVKSSTQPIVVSVPICQYDDTESAKAARRQLKEAIYSALFGMDVPAVCAINQAILALYAARRTSGIVVNIGFHQTSVVPILHGKAMRKIGVEVVGIGALKLTGFLREQLQQKNINFGSLYTVGALKENLCYVALDYEAELSKDAEASFEERAEGWFTLSKERFQTGEILFQPRIAGLRAMGLHQAVALCMDHCQATEVTPDEGWFKTIVLSGGSAAYQDWQIREGTPWIFSLLPVEWNKSYSPSLRFRFCMVRGKARQQFKKLPRLLVHDKKAISNEFQAQADMVKHLQLMGVWKFRDKETKF